MFSRELQGIYYMFKDLKYFVLLYFLVPPIGYASQVGKALLREPISPIPLHTRVDDKKVALGKQLFNDKRLSANNTISCATCHPLNKAGMDGNVISIGINGNSGIINTPTVFNSALNFAQFWDGRALTLEEQIDGPIHASNEMGTDWSAVVGKLNKDSKLITQFNKIYPEGISAKTIKNAIATFERSLNTPNSRFDHYLRGDMNAISKREKEGYLLFKSYGCSSCHQGVSVGGNMYEKMGVIYNYFVERGDLTKADNGRFNITGDEEHRYEFKVPSLRNIKLTAPYFHDGTALTLYDAVKVMSKYQLGRTINDKDTRKIVEFLHTLTGDFGEYANE